VNTSSTTSTSAASSARSEPGRNPRDDRQADDFARLLRHKEAGSEAECDDAPGEQPMAMAGNPQHAMQAPHCAAGPVAPAAEVVAANPSQRTAAIEAMAAVQSRLELAGPVDAAAARRFDVSLHEPAGLQLSMRIVQPVAEGGRWALSVSSTDLNPQLLRRNTGRLEERLRSRLLSSEPVRIEHDDDS